jgi:hypothetical protein
MTDRSRLPTFTPAGTPRSLAREVRLRQLPVVGAVAGLLLVACGSREPDIRLVRVRAERRNLEATLDRLEDRMLASQARVRLWQALRERHESVSAIACASQEEHADGMALHQLKQPSSLDRARVAAVSPAPAATLARPPGAPRKTAGEDGQGARLPSGD